MGFFSSIQAKVTAISVTAMSAYSIVKMLPERLEAFNEGNYAEAFLGKKWAKILNPDAYADEDTKETETAKENDSDLQPVELTVSKGFDVESGTFSFVTPEIAFSEYENRMNISDETLRSLYDDHDFDGLDLQQNLLNGKLYAMAALGQIDGAYLAHSYDTAQMYSDYFKNLDLTDEQKAFYTNYINNVDALSKSAFERYNVAGKYSSYDLYLDMNEYHMNIISNVEEMQPQTSGEYYNAKHSLGGESYFSSDGKDAIDYATQNSTYLSDTLRGITRESTSDTKSTRDPSLQAETDALAALGNSSTSTELSYGG